MDDEYREFLEKKNEGKKTIEDRISRSAYALVTILQDMPEKEREKEMKKIIASIILMCTDSFDDAYLMIEMIKERIARSEGEYIRSINNRGG